MRPGLENCRVSKLKQNACQGLRDDTGTCAQAGAHNRGPGTTLLRGKAQIANCVHHQLAPALVCGVRRGSSASTAAASIAGKACWWLRVGSPGDSAGNASQRLPQRQP
jgi:hypothetical protein